MTTDLALLHGNELDNALTRRFAVVKEEVTVNSSHYTLLRPENADHLISEQDYVMDERLPYWADLWPSSRMLAAALLRENGEGLRLLEMGCGLGLATTAAMQAGFDTTATDYYEDAIHVTRANAWRNLGREPRIRLVNWRYWPDDLGLFDVIAAADVLYEKEYASLVAQRISEALAPDGFALVVDPGRTFLPDFRSRIEEEGLSISETIVEEWQSTPTTRQQIQVMRIRRSAPSSRSQDAATVSGSL